MAINGEIWELHKNALLVLSQLYEQESANLSLDKIDEKETLLDKVTVLECISDLIDEVNILKNKIDKMGCQE